MKIIILSLVALLICACSGRQNETSHQKAETPPIEIGEQIARSLERIGEIEEYPDGFTKLEDIDFRFINIAGFHTRKGIYKDLFLFPYWNVNVEVNEESADWKTGIAFRKNSPIIYSWRLD